MRVLIFGIAVLMMGADPVPAPRPLSAGQPQVVLAGQPPAAFPPVTPKSDVARLKAESALLATERDEASKETTASTSVERAILRRQLDELLKRLDRPPTGNKSTGIPQTSGSSQGRSFELGGNPNDRIRAAENLFRNEEIQAALSVFQEAERLQLSREDHAFVRYMAACCMRKLGKNTEAAVIFREVANAREDEFVSECAISQLALIRSTQDLEAQLEILRSRPKSR